MRFKRKRRIRTHNPPRGHKPYTHAKSRTTCAKPLTGRKIRTTYAPRLIQPSRTNQQEKKLSVMECREKKNSTRVNCDWKKSRKVNAPISLEDLMVKELPSSLEECDICKLSVLTDPTNEDSTCIKQKIRILDHPKNLL